MGTEIERKFLVSYVPEKLMKNGTLICQGYIVKQKDKVLRVRISGDTASLTLKGPTENFKRKEYAYPIALPEAKELLEHFCEPPFVEKTRYSINYKGSEWIIDQFSGGNDGLVVAEIELNARAQTFEKPDWIGKEVSTDPRYFNSNLVSFPFSQWR